MTKLNSDQGKCSLEELETWRVSAIAWLKKILEMLLGKQFEVQVTDQAHEYARKMVLGFSEKVVA